MARPVARSESFCVGWCHRPVANDWCVTAPGSLCSLNGLTQRSTLTRWVCVIRIGGNPFACTSHANLICFLSAAVSPALEANRVRGERTDTRRPEAALAAGAGRADDHATGNLRRDSVRDALDPRLTTGTRARLSFYWPAEARCSTPARDYLRSSARSVDLRAVPALQGSQQLDGDTRTQLRSSDEAE